MFSAFTTVFSSLQGFFSRTFWFGAFLPVLLFSGLHFGIAILAFPKAIAGLKPLTDTGTAPLLFVGLIVLAYMLLPLLPWMKGLLDGTLLPEVIRDYLRKLRLVGASEENRIMSQRLQCYGGLRQLQRKFHGNLSGVYKSAKLLGGADQQALIDAAIAAVAGFAAGPNAGNLRYGQSALQAVQAALEVNNPELPADHADAAASLQLGDACDRLELLISEAAAEAEYDFNVAQRRQRTGADQIVEATRVGDAGRVIERHCREVYDAEFDFLWPRLMLCLTEKDPVLANITIAASQIDFSVISTLLAATLLVWPPVLAVFGTSWQLFLLVGCAAPVLIGFFNNLTFESQLAFGEVAKTAIDSKRLEVLKLLRLPVPVSRSSERELWNRLRETDENAALADLVYAPEVRT